MIFPPQIRIGRWVVLDDGTKKYISDVDLSGDRPDNPVHHFAVYLTKDQHTEEGEWVSPDRVERVIGKNPYHDDATNKPVDLGVASWSNTIKQMNESEEVKLFSVTAPNSWNYEVGTFVTFKNLKTYEITRNDRTGVWGVRRPDRDAKIVKENKYDWTSPLSPGTNVRLITRKRRRFSAVSGKVLSSNGNELVIQGSDGKEYHRSNPQRIFIKEFSNESPICRHCPHPVSKHNQITGKCSWCQCGREEEMLTLKNRRMFQPNEVKSLTALISEATQLEVGTKEEMEHTDDPAIARKIALDHLKEDPKYYTKLKSAGLEETENEAICPSCHQVIDVVNNRLIKHRVLVYGRGKKNLELKPCLGSNSVVGTRGLKEEMAKCSVCGRFDQVAYQYGGATFNPKTGKVEKEKQEPLCPRCQRTELNEMADETTVRDWLKRNRDIFSENDLIRQAASRFQWPKEQVKSLFNGLDELSLSKLIPQPKQYTSHAGLSAQQWKDLAQRRKHQQILAPLKKIFNPREEE